MKRFIPFLFVCLIAAANPFVGTWEGHLDVEEYSLPYVIRLFEGEKGLQGEMDIPQQNAWEMRLLNLTVDGQKIHYEIDSPAGVGKYDGKLLDGFMEGTFSQKRFVGDWTLFPKEIIEKPFYTEEIAVENDGFVLPGTFSRPESNGRHPAVVLATGSGIQNRDEEVFGFKVFEVIADYLTQRGYAVLRCDDRGYGLTPEDIKDVTTLDFASDIEAQIEYLKTRDDIDPEQIGILGHSEGGLIAPIIANQRDDIAFIVLMAAPSIPGKEVIYNQIEVALSEMDLPEEKVENLLETQRMAEEAVANGEISPELEERLKDQIREQLSGLPNAPENLDSIVQLQYEAKTAAMLLPWTRWYFEYDPQPALKELDVPALALFGGKDAQVSEQLNHGPMENALSQSKSKYDIEVFPEANHLFQEAETGSISEYAKLKQEFVPGFLERVFLWMESNTDFPK